MYLGIFFSSSLSSLSPSLIYVLLSNYIHFFMKFSWNFVNLSTTASILSSAGKNVVRKCHVPST